VTLPFPPLYSSNTESTAAPFEKVRKYSYTVKDYYLKLSYSWSEIYLTIIPRTRVVHELIAYEARSAE
jgi:hypothetical protein